MSNPILESFFESDGIGQLIFLSLALLSVISWTLLIVRLTALRKAKRSDLLFLKHFKSDPSQVMSITCDDLNPTAVVFTNTKHYILQLLNKNRQFGAVDAKTGIAYLSIDDIHMISELAYFQVQQQLHLLEQHVHHLSTVVTLAPFLGLFGTVWGILISFHSMTGTAALSSQLMFMGLSMALATTVVGLIVAIPALIGHNVIKGLIKQFESHLNDFISQMLSFIELQYRKVDKNSHQDFL